MTTRILIGDCRDVLKTLPDESVHCCITSPPYWKLRSYLPQDHPNKAQEIGNEPTVHDWVQTMVEVFREVGRVLRKDGTLFLNLGDNYVGNSGVHVPGLKPKDMVGQPWRVAFALQGFATISCMTLAEWADTLQAARAAGDWGMVELVEQRIRAWDFTEAMKHAGWWLRQEIIWAKRSPMPESVRDRFTKSHEHVFLLSKSSNYYFDFDAIQEPASMSTHERAASTGVGFGHGYDEKPKPRQKTPAGWDTGPGDHRRQAGRYPATPKAALATSGNDGAYADGKSGRMGSGAGWRNKNNADFDAAMAVMPATRNPRSVRWLSSEPFRGAHFATYPAELIRPFVLAGCPPGGTVLDPFGGSGTTALVADREGRHAILIDLDERNEAMAAGRVQDEAGLFADVSGSGDD